MRDWHKWHGARQDDPVEDEANDCKTENAGAGGEVRGAEVAREVWAREADEIADKIAGGGEAVRDKTAGRVEDFPDRSLQQEPEVLEKLEKFFVKVLK